MSIHARCYRAVLCLYPRAFRRDYGHDLVELFLQLVSDRGPREAWRRTLLDLTITVPRYRLETLMSPSRSNLVINITLAILVVAGFIGILAYGVLPGVVILGVAAAVALTQRSQLARSLRSVDRDQRRRRLALAAVSGAVLTGAVIGYLLAIGDGHISSGALAAYNLVGFTALVITIFLLAAGLRTPRATASAMTTTWDRQR